MSVLGGAERERERGLGRGVGRGRVLVIEGREGGAMYDWVGVEEIDES